jgi:hypothetical protein
MHKVQKLDNCMIFALGDDEAKASELSHNRNLSNIHTPSSH